MMQKNGAPRRLNFLGVKSGCIQSELGSSWAREICLVIRPLLIEGALFDEMLDHPVMGIGLQRLCQKHGVCGSGCIFNGATDRLRVD